MKKGVVEVQFNWIFVLIAGGVILIFFFNIATGQSQLFSLLFKGSVLKDLNAIFIGAEVSRGTSSLIDIPNIILDFECERYTLEEVAHENRNRIIFGPSNLEGKQLITWSYDWNVPYRVTNFLYITNPLVQYVFVNSGTAGDHTDQFFTELFKDIPHQITRITTKSLGAVKDENYQQVRFIFYDEYGSSVDMNQMLLNRFKSYSDSDISALRILYMTPDEFQYPHVPSGLVEFYEKTTKPESKFKLIKSASFYGKASLLGAIFSNQHLVADEDKLIYECIMERAFKKYDLVTTVYKDRTSILQQYYTAHPSSATCQNFYQTSEFTKIQQSILAGYGLNNIDKAQTAGENLRIQNEFAERASCPHIY